jgi:hypothetical protein
MHGNNPVDKYELKIKFWIMQNFDKKDKPNVSEVKWTLTELRR